MKNSLGRLLAGAVLCAGFAAGVAQADVGPNTKLDATGVSFANVSISVSDIEKSTAFYKALGFEAGDKHDLPPMVAKLLGASATDTPKLDIRFLKRDGVVLELVHFTPAAKHKASEGSASQLGLAHIAFRVDDVDRIAGIIKQNGGATLDKTRTKMGQGPQGIDILFCTDPDGTLMEIAGPAKG